LSVSEVLVLGAGVSGLSTAIVLAERGHRVRIVAEKDWQHGPSGKAGGLWLPYRIEPRHRVLGWSAATYRTLIELAQDPTTGVLLREQVELYREDRAPEEIWWLSEVPDYRKMRSDELPAEYASGFSSMLPVMDVPFYMPYLQRRFSAAGGRTEIGRPIESLDSLLSQYKTIVNCTGLGARTLCNDRELIPIRGQLVRTSNPGVVRSIADEHHPLGFAYVIARSTDCILGGTAQEHREDQDIDPRERQRIIDVNTALEPRLGEATILEDSACLRPYRTSVRLEREDRNGSAIIHNYGHGGAGFTVSWGCAFEAAGLVEDSLSRG
jgi:D-amino-acid oxidase